MPSIEMTNFQIKCIAIITMLSDHIGIVFFPDQLMWRVVGRITFPLFAWFIASGAVHTRDMPKYLSNLVLLAFISEVPFLLLNWEVDPNYFSLNALFTLTLGLIAIIALKELPHVLLRIGAVATCAILATYLHADYGAWGVLSVVAFWLTRSDVRMRVAGALAIFALCYIIPVFFPSPDIQAATLMIFLRSAPVQTILKWCQDGSQHPRFSERDLLAIPVPDAVADASAGIEAMVRSAFNARARSRALLAAAKRAVEIAIEVSEEASLAYLATAGGETNG